MRILFLPQYDANGPSSRIRVYQLQPFLRALGVSTNVKPLLTGDVKTLVAALFSAKSIVHKTGTALIITAHFLKRYGHVLSALSYDAVVVQKDVLPFGLLALLRLVTRNIVYEFDDAIWEETPGEKKKSLITAVIFRYRSRLFHRIVRHSKAVIAENTYLADYTRKLNPNVHVITAPIDTDKYRPQTDGDRSGPIVLGWIGSPGTTYLLESIAPALNAIGRRFPSVVVHNIGGLPIGLTDIAVKNIRWTEESELQYLRAFTIGLMPLDETPFNRGRLGYKMIIYASLGLPTVASAVGLNPTVVRHGETGFLVSNEDEWVACLLILMADRNLRRRMGQAARQLAINNYDVRAAAQTYRTILHSVALSTA